MSNTFSFVGNDLAIDFINTCVNVQGKETDLIATPDKLSQWLDAAGLRSDATRWTAEDTVAIAGLRDDIREAILAMIEDRTPPANALNTINRHLSRYDANERIAFSGGTFQLIDRERTLSAHMVMGLLAERAAKLLTSDENHRVRSCVHPNCILLFKDTSKGGRRRWCSMKTCGNRAKARTFRTNVGQSGTPE